MRHVFKYLLAAAVMLGGFYTAQQYRIRQPHDGETAQTTSAGTIGATPVENRETGTADAHEGLPSRNAAPVPLPIAAIGDVDRLCAPTTQANGQLDIDKIAQELTGNSSAARPSLKNQPTVKKSSVPDATAKQLVTGTEPSVAQTKDFQKGPKADGQRRPQEEPKGESAAKRDTKPFKPKHRNQGEQPQSPLTDPSSAPRYIATRADKIRTPSGEPTDRFRESRPATPPADEVALPIFAENFHPRLSPLEEPQGELTAQARPERRTPERERLAARTAVVNQPRTPSVQTARWRRHRIVDGDTLRQLAARYLGSSDQYQAIFEANPDVLFDPRLLPIGVEIVIPDRATGVPITAPPRQTETASAAKVTDDDGLEPIPHFALPGKSRLQDGT